MARDVAPDPARPAVPTLPAQDISIIRDQRSCFPLINILSDEDLLILLTPVLAPLGEEDDNVDPFEPLGRALALRHPWVRHVPYTVQNGITDFHTVFLRRAKLIMVLIAGASSTAQTSQFDVAETARLVSEHRPLVVVVCEDAQVQAKTFEKTEFETILQSPGYAHATLERLAAVLFGELVPALQEVVVPAGHNVRRRQWEVEALPDSLVMFDVSPLLNIWNECLPQKFHLDRFTLQNLLDRDGFGKHYVVKLPQTGEIIAFCATYTTWAFSDPEDLVGSVAVLLVKPAYRNRGIGLSLYNYAKDLLTRTRGVKHLQLGSTFPRLLAGIPWELGSQDWFKRRGWDLESQLPGRGKEICDWLLRIQDWPNGEFGSIPEGFQVRQCLPDDFPHVLEFVRTEASRNDTMGLFENYKWSRDYSHDIVLCTQGSTIVATALTYMANSGTTADTDLPWARKLGFDVGGITCICISEQTSALRHHRNSLMVRLLGTCIEKLRNDGMQRVFLDGIRGGDQGFEDLGFRKWSAYRDVWRPV